jgi:polysaccharide biosynthesis transport protein
MDTRLSEAIVAPDQAPVAFSESTSIAELIERVTGFVRRQFPIFVFVTPLALALGLLYYFTTPPSYTAHTKLIIDSSKMRVLQPQQPQTTTDMPLDTAQVETQLEVLKSDRVGLAVIKDLRLTENPEFASRGEGRGLLSAILGIGARSLSPPQQSSETAAARNALKVLNANRSVTRIGRTYTLDIAYTSGDPAQAATIANAIADAYITDELESKYQATRRASGWLQDRIKELRAQASAADAAVLDYKEKNNIVDFGGSSPTSPVGARLMGEQEIQELTTQLGAARTAMAEAKARLERIREVMSKEIPDAAVADSLHNEVINRLRNQYLDLSARETIFSARYGANHLAVVNLRTQIHELRRSIADELARIAESYKSDYEIAKTRQEQLEQNLAKLVSSSRAINRDRLGLRELESQAQVHHTIYENFLQRYMEAVQQQSFPITEARVISEAAPPTRKTSPIAFTILAVAGALGLVFSFGIATLREALDRVFRTTRQVEEALRTSCLAVLPMMKDAAAPLRRRKKRSPEEADPDRKLASDAGQLLRYVVEHPLAPFAESIRAIKVSAEIAGVIKNNKVIGVTSTSPREGKSTVSSNLTQLIAHAGKRVVLVDGDLRNPALTHNLAPGAKAGLLEVLAGKIDLDEALYVDEQTKLAFLPIIKEGRLAHTDEILASDPFKRLIDTLQKSYDYVVVDLPPLAPVVDARASINVIDAYLYVVEWGRTRIRAVQHQLASAPELYDRLLGIVLNKANVRILGRYEYYYGTYYKKYYARPGYGGYGYGNRYGNYPS